MVNNDTFGSGHKLFPFLDNGKRIFDHEMEFKLCLCVKSSYMMRIKPTDVIIETSVEDIDLNDGGEGFNLAEFTFKLLF